jgi:hypothetical protein
MSFLIDPPWLYANGRGIAAVTDDQQRATALGAATMALFWGVSIPLYLDRRWTRPIWRGCRARSGRDWMINSGLTDFEYERPSTATHAAAAAMFATYPLWLYLGYRHGRR